ncbi:MAG: Zn-dependent hydrolase of the beta-lactamase fold-like protein [Bryobacterales bacterium]|nr:Zn-dependent hydrolase of the beta-lactamase fold-like protein [Bryobacterales bacterium]
MTISHNHTDHNFSQGVKGTFTLVDGRPVTARTEVTAAGLAFVQIPGFHDNTNGSARGPNTLVRWTQARTPARARKAFVLFREGRHKAALNFGACFTYALAKACREPLLFKGLDFIHTDLQDAAALDEART